MSQSNRRLVTDDVLSIDSLGAVCVSRHREAALVTKTTLFRFDITRMLANMGPIYLFLIIWVCVPFSLLESVRSDSGLKIAMDEHKVVPDVVDSVPENIVEVSAI